MQKFEVYVPSTQAVGKTYKIRVEANNWMEALNSGLAALGEEGGNSGQVMCDLRPDGSIHVTDSKTKRVFKIIPLSDKEYAAAPPANFQPQSTTANSQIFVDPKGKTEEQIGRSQETGVSLDDVLAEMFEKMQDILSNRNADQVLSLILDTALEKVPSESGTVFKADLDTSDLVFHTTRGPKANEVKAFRLEMNEGIVGFSCCNGVGLAVSDVQKDPRWSREISDRVGYNVGSLLCVPIKKGERVYGAIELINKKGSTVYSSGELDILTYLASQAAEYFELNG